MIVIGIAVLFAIAIRFLPKRTYPLISLCAAALLAFLAFHVQVIQTSDLYRHFGQIDLYRTVGSDFALKRMRSEGNPLTIGLFFLFSFLEDNRWLPAAIVFAVYMLLTNLIRMVAEDEKLDRRWLSLCTAFVLLNFNYVNLVYALRMWLVFAVFAFCLYVETVRDKKKVLCWAIYCILLFFHYGATFLLIARLLAYFITNPPKTPKLAIKFFAMLFVVIIGAYYLFNSNLGTFMTEKYEGYQLYDTRGTWQTLVSWLRATTVFVLAAYELIKIKNKEYKGYAWTLIFLFIIMLVQIQNYQITLRFADGLIALAPPLFIRQNRKMSISDFITGREILLLGTTAVYVLFLTIFDYRILNFVF